MPGCGGLRKVRVADRGRGKGKRGGARVIYLSIPEADRIDMIAVDSKDERDELRRSRRRCFALWLRRLGVRRSQVFSGTRGANDRTQRQDQRI